MCVCGERMLLSNTLPLSAVVHIHGLIMRRVWPCALYKHPDYYYDLISLLKECSCAKIYNSEVKETWIPSDLLQTFFLTFYIRVVFLGGFIFFSLTENYFCVFGCF